MVQVTVEEAKMRFSELLDLASSGERVVVCKANQPWMEFKPLVKPAAKTRTLGLAAGKIELTDHFFDPMSSDALDFWSNGHSSDPLKK